MNQLVTVKQAAEMLAVSEAAVRKWLYQRRLQAVKVGRLTRLRMADIQRVAAEGLHSQQPADP
jgi:excisionase family DNA binding protein